MKENLEVNEMKLKAKEEKVKMKCLKIIFS